MPDTIITRHGYCEECYKANRPHSEDLYVAFGTYRNGYHTKYALGNGIRGYVPTIYKLRKVVGTKVVYEFACSFCDYELEPAGYQNLDVIVVWRKKGFMPIKDWNALVTYKRDNQYLI